MTATAPRCRTKSIYDLSDTEVDTCRGLTLDAWGGEGTMLPKFNRFLRTRSREAYATTIRCNGIVIGWALTFKPFYPKNGEWESLFFVNPHYRRFGYGTRLFRHIERKFGCKPFVHPWDDTSTKFFRKVLTH